MRKGTITTVATISDLVTFIQAAHVSQDTNWDLQARGGVMLVSYPEQLKTSILSASLGRYPEVMLVSDMNVREFSDIREDLLTQRYDTIGFLDYQKVWERDERTSANVEGVIRALTDEGWNGTLGGKQMKGAPARAFLILCMTPGLYNAKLDNWKKNGFHRRFIAMHYQFRDRRLLEESIKQGRSYQLSIRQHIMRPTNRLTYKVTESEANFIQLALKEQKGLVALQLLLRIYNTMKWHFDEVMKEPDRAMQLLMNIMPMFNSEGGDLTADNVEPLLVVGEPGPRRKPAATRKRA